MTDKQNAKNSFSDYTEAQFMQFMDQILFANDKSSDAVLSKLLDRFSQLIEHPAGTDLIYWPEPGAEESAQGVINTVKQWREANGLPGFKPADPTCKLPERYMPGTMDIRDIQKPLIRPASKLTVGGSNITQPHEESWIGKVVLFRPDEGVPKNEACKELRPFAQLYLPTLPFQSPLLDGISVLTLFVADPLPDALEPMGNNWVLREYRPDDVLVRKDLPVAGSVIRSVQVHAELVAEDFPLSDGGGIPHSPEAEICETQIAGKIENFDDLGRHTYGHKIGGYPSFYQSGIDPGDDFEFIFQLSSDPEINLNIVDCGSLMFWKNRCSGEWVMYYDFY